MPTLKEIVDRAWTTTDTVVDATRHVRLWLDAMAALDVQVASGLSPAQAAAAMKSLPDDDVAMQGRLNLLLAQVLSESELPLETQETAPPVEPTVPDKPKRTPRVTDKSVANAGLHWGESECRFAAKLYDRDRKTFTQIGKALDRTRKSVQSAFRRGLVPSERFAAERRRRGVAHVWKKPTTMNGQVSKTFN